MWEFQEKVECIAKALEQKRLVHKFECVIFKVTLWWDCGLKRYVKALFQYVLCMGDLRANIYATIMKGVWINWYNKQNKRTHFEICFYRQNETNNP